MPFVVELRDASGNRLGRTGESPPKKVLPLPDAADSAFPLLRGLDPYADTFFTSYQMQWLIQELNALVSGATTDDERELIAEVLQLAQRCADTPHAILLFVGD